MKISFTNYTLTDAATHLLAEVGEQRILCFKGNLGAGKTTFIKTLLQNLGAEDKGSSPSFAIINEYKTPFAPVYHFDLYRLRSQGELLDLGFYDYIDSGAWCFIEWPELAEPLLENYMIVSITKNADESRTLTTEKINTIGQHH